LKPVSAAKREAKVTEKLLKELKFGVLKYSDPAPEALLVSTTMSQLLAVPYKYSEAGSNPREFQGMKSGTNKKILESLIRNHKTTFWALHSGVSITVIKGRTENDTLNFDDACLTNGLQTVTIGRILTLIKTYQLYTKKNEIHTKINANMEEKWNECINTQFSADISKQLVNINLQHVNSVLNWLWQPDNQECLAIVNNMMLPDILNTKLSVKAVLLDELSEFADVIDGEPDLETLGNEIAEANNDTQKLDPGDLFGTGNQAWLEQQLFNKPLKNAVVEYRRFSENRRANNQKVIHVLDLLRAILPTTFIVDAEIEDLASFVADYANRREPIYNWFNKVIKTHQQNERPEIKRVVTILQNLTPSLVDMMFRVQVPWDEQRKDLSFPVVNAWTPLNKTSLGAEIFEDKKMTKPNEKADAEIKRFLSFSFSNLFTIFLFATRTAIKVADDLSVTYDIDDSTISQMVKEIYKTLAKERLKKTLGSTSNLFRDPDIYRTADDLYKVIIQAKGQQHSDSPTHYRVKLA
jgi:hypothetical protein